MQHERVIIVLARAEQDTCSGQTSELQDSKKQFELKLFNLELVCEDLGCLNIPLQFFGLNLGHERIFMFPNLSSLS